jgi:hypothetical protein
LFSISNHQVDLAAANDRGAGSAQPDISLLSQFCIVDHWSANLSNAMMSLGDTARSIHQLPPDRDRFGLLEFVRCYESGSQTKIIQLFEMAASEGRPFHFSASLAGSDGSRQIVHCFGGHRTVEATQSGEELFGMFLFSRALFVEL